MPELYDGADCVGASFEISALQADAIKKKEKMATSQKGNDLKKSIAEVAASGALQFLANWSKK